MNGNIKIGLVLVFIILVFVILKIRKLEVRCIPNDNSNLYQTLELFDGKDKKFCELDILDKFHQEKDTSMKTLESQSLTNIIGLTKNNTGIPTNLIFGPTGFCFDSSNDDVIILDIYQLKRYQLRIDRSAFTSDTVNYQLEFKKVLNDSAYHREKLSFILKQLNSSITFTTLPLDDANLDANIAQVITQALTKLDDDKIKDKFPLKIEFNPYEDDANSPSETHNFSLEDVKNQLTFLYKYYQDNYLKLNKCEEKPGDCQISYQRDMPPFNLELGKKGLHDLVYDKNSETILHPNRVDDTIKPYNNSWLQYRNKGIFKPHISNLNKSLFFEEGGEGGKGGKQEKKQEIYGLEEVKMGLKGSQISKGKNQHQLEEFVGGIRQKVPYLNVYFKEKFKALFYLNDELENIGVGMYFHRNFDMFNAMFVPDTENNRIQVFQNSDQGFTYLGQFGNTEYVSERSLPRYDAGNNLPPIMYEPLIDTDNDAFQKIGSFTCDNTDLDTEEFSRSGPFLVSPSPSGTKVNSSCDVDYNLDNFDIHSRNMLKTDTKIGYLNTLVSEYERVNQLDVGKSAFTEMINYDNPHHIGEDLTYPKAGKDGVSQKTLAYRKLLYKAIKIANEGQKLGQLFRPKSIAFDEDINKDGQKYYVVDTYHHCIQCFTRGANVTTRDGTKNMLTMDTLDGKEYLFSSADEELNQNPDIWAYDASMNPNFNNYNNCRMYSLGIRQKLIMDSESGQVNSLLNTHSDWATANGQTIESRPLVQLFRWLSGSSKYANNSFSGDAVVNYNAIDSMFQTPLMTDFNKKNNPGLGEFLYPSDISISKDIYSGEQLLMVADTGNNRVSIFKKFQFSDSDGTYYRFRFYRFLDETGSDNIINPISLTVCPHTGRVFVLNGNFYATPNKQTIKVFKPLYNDGKTKFVFDDKIPIGITGNKKLTKIKIDDRGILIGIDIANSINKIKILEPYKLSDSITNFEIQNIQSRLSNVYLNCQFNFTDINNLRRFRIIAVRKNISKKEELSYVMSKEYMIENKYKKGKLHPDSMNTKYTLVDKINEEELENYWITQSMGSVKKIGVDFTQLEDGDPNNKKILVSKKPNFDVNKVYRTRNENGSSVTYLENTEDWKGKGMSPNTTYQYEIYLTNYLGLQNKTSEVKEVTTLPLGYNSERVFKNYEFKKEKHQIKLTFKYGDLSVDHFKTQAYNPLYCYIFRKEHNRTRDVATKYINCGKEQFIQLILPGDSKYLHSKFSKPKFGKLYIFNCYQNGNVIEQDTLMNINTYYRPDYQVIYYAANGGLREDGGFPVPLSESINGNNFLDDFFTLGDNPQNIHAKIKFRVRIRLDQVPESEEEKIIDFIDREKLETNLKYYSRDKKVNEHTMVLVEKKPLFKDDNNYPSTIDFIDTGNSEYPFSRNPILPNKTYEYCVLVGNCTYINPGGNSFYVTTKPKEIINSKINYVDMVDEGQKKMYLRLEWHTRKNAFNYWPYNFLIMRKVAGTKMPALEVESGQNDNQEFFDIADGIIRLKSLFTKETYHHNFKVSSGNHILSLSILNVRDKKEGREIKYTQDKLKKGSFIWKPTSGSNTFTNVKNEVSISLDLYKGETLKDIKLIKEPLAQDSKTTATRQKIAEIVKQREEQAREQQRKREDLEAKREANLENFRNKQLGEVFLLDDDYEETERSNYKGYSGELYQYLLKKNKNQLLKIFDDLHERVLKYHGDVTMKMEGPAGMLRSGNTDMLIDKIRYMSMLMREEKNSALESMDLKCDSNNLKNIIKNTTEGGINGAVGECKSLDTMKREAQEKKDREAEIELQKEKEKLESQELELQNQIQEQKDIQEAASQAEKEVLEESLKELETQLAAEKARLEKDSKYQKIKEDIADIKSKPDQSVTDTSNLLPENIDNLNDPENVLNKYKEGLNINEVIKNRMYTGNYGNAIYGEKMQMDLYGPKSFLDNLAKAFATKKMIRENYLEIKSIVYDFEAKEIYFVVPGENIGENLGSLFYAANFIILLVNQGSESDKKKEIETENKSKEKEIQAKIEEKKAALLAFDDKIDVKQDPDVQRLEKQLEKTKGNIKDTMSVWTVLKEGKPEMPIPNNPSSLEVQNIYEEYGIIPTMAKLSSSIKDGSQIYSPTKLDNSSMRDRKILESQEFITHQQLIEKSAVDNINYEYRIATYQTGFSFNSETKRSFMGAMTEEIDELPKLYLGENVSMEIFEDGKPRLTTLSEDIPLPPVISYAAPPAPLLPQITYFTPKEGYQNSVMKIVGLNLDEIEYFCFRDVKVKILQKGQTYIEKDGQRLVYDEYLIKVPTLHELGKECWQSLQPYEVLVWGYHRGSGKQIRTEEVSEETNGKLIRKKLMFRYLDRVECPDEYKIDIPT